MTVQLSREVEVRPLGSATAYAAALHARSLPHGFFARLGRPFLRAYYDSFVASPYAVALSAFAGGRLSGVLVGTLDTGAHYSWVLRRRGLRLALLGAGGLALRPRLATTFLRTRAGRYLRRAWDTPRDLALSSSRGRRGGPARGEGVAVLTHVAVDVAARGTGAGTRLVGAFVEAARAAGADRAALVTLAGEDGAGPFYEGLGWTHTGDRQDRDGRTVSAFSLNLR